MNCHLDLAALNDNLEDSALWVSIYNLTDEAPPFARLDLNYDPYTHNPFGQMIKVGVRHKFQRIAVKQKGRLNIRRPFFKLDLTAY